MLQRVNASVDLALMEWDQGRRKLERLDVPPKREAVYREVVDEIVAELTRRVGQTYTLDDLAREYATSAAWCRLIAHRTTDNVWAHDLTIVGDAASPASHAARRTTATATEPGYSARPGGSRSDPPRS